jgi:hypothetical protein
VEGPESPRSPDAAAKKAGRWIPLSLHRRLICDLLHFAQKVPTVPVQRPINVAAVREQLERLSKPPGWCAIFTKAFGIVAQRFKELRRAYLPFPWAHLYEHPISIASVAIEREYQGENVVFWNHLRAPETQTLAALQGHLSRFKTEPIETFGNFRRALAMGRLPRPLRRCMWWLGLNSSGVKRAQRMGTFGVSVYSGLGAESLHPLSPLTTTMNYGVVQPDGQVAVRIVYDHRVMDGATVARALAYMEQVLSGEILAELRNESLFRAA